MRYDPEKYKRTHTCGELRKEDTGKKVLLVGWVNRRRDLGGLIFVDLRDRYGLIQVAFNPAQNGDVFGLAESLKNEYVIAVRGIVNLRPEGTINPKLPTGEIEVQAGELTVLNPSKIPPFNLAEAQNTDEMLRMKYRYLDMRRPAMMKRLVLRHNVAKAVRDFFDREGFLEIETPSLVRSTPEGARDYLVPSRVNPGRFYALPQSPQLFKQLLMVGGVDRYFQMARCYRDEDLRADRQPEFTQIDLEMSFVRQEDILKVIEDMLVYVFERTMPVKLKTPFVRISHKEAMSCYGIDKPDMRYGLTIRTITEVVRDVDFEPFKKATTEGGCVRGITLAGAASISRKELNEIVELGKSCGLAGLLTIQYRSDGIKSYLSKFMNDEKLMEIRKEMEASEGDLVLIAAGEGRVLAEGLGKLRLELVSKFKIAPQSEFSFLWVLDFPLVSYNREEDRLEAEHHPFTSPHPDDVHLMDTEPLKVRANSYDLVLNGVELGSGSIRIHDREMQEKLFKLIGLSEEEAMLKFGFLLSAFEYGAPPHGGIALGFDRLLAIMAGMDSIREVLAFPKNQSAICPLTGAPVTATDEQLKLLRIRVEDPINAST